MTLTTPLSAPRSGEDRRAADPEPGGAVDVEARALERCVVDVDPLEEVGGEHSRDDVVGDDGA